jgi:hypothetical protein
MPPGIAAGTANSVLALMLNGTVWAGYSVIYAQLHIGQPGAAGTANIAGESLRVSCGGAPAFAAPSSGQTLNNNVITWNSVTASETYAFCSLWTALTAGVFIASGTVTAAPIVVGNNFSIPVGGLAVSLPLAS